MAPSIGLVELSRKQCVTVSVPLICNANILVYASINPQTCEAAFLQVTLEFLVAEVGITCSSGLSGVCAPVARQSFCRDGPEYVVFGPVNMAGGNATFECAE